ncbi:PqqD family protein [Tepidamorphus sp. 3E244]|uniref:PqqD family protein n=1 Tax=Tepidamorphus sp. 3E244 TaxID=3385498 RepID=UPI0038FC7DA7
MSNHGHSPNGHVPCRAIGVRSFAVGDECILISPRRFEDAYDAPDEHQALTLNHSGAAIWEACNGQRTHSQIATAVARTFDVDTETVAPHVAATLREFARAGLLNGTITDPALGNPYTFVTGIEDKPYLHWQTAIFLESLAGKLPDGWQSLVVVCNGGAPLSDDLSAILSRYNTQVATGRDHARAMRIDTGHADGEAHAALNRVEALKVAADHVGEGEMVCLLDTDVFFYDGLPLELLPQSNALARNWHIETTPFFSSIDINEGAGIDLQKLLEAMGCKAEFKPGGVNVFLTAETVRDPKFIADCFRFSQALFMLGRTAGARLTWISEMPCFALALSANGLEHDLLEAKQFLVSDCNEAEIPPGTIYHYYSDPRDFGRTAFRDSAWHKQAYVSQNFLETDFSGHEKKATTDHERYFFKLARAARDRCHV